MIDQRILVSFPFALSLVACKLGKSDDDPATRPLPIVLESASEPVQAEAPHSNRDPAPARPRTPSSPKPRAAPDKAPAAAANQGSSDDAPSADKKPSDPSAASPTKKESDPAASTTAPSADPTPTTAPTLIKAPNPECFGKCAAALQSCLQNATTDGNPDLNKSSQCGGAFDTCKNGCLK